MSERRGTKALETWCRRLTEGYPGVKVENMTTSWRDGLAFCAIIHHFRPDLIDFASLSASNIYYNNSLAFSVAERQLGIPALLDAEDMVMYAVPDRLSILTYLSQFYQVFGNQGSVAAGQKQGTSQRIVPKRSAIAADRGMISSASSSPPTKMESRSSIGVTGVPTTGLSRREPCAKCGFPVFLAERLNVGTKLYHRTCFRCARCNNQLSLANCYETETDGQYCCETCPDEEDQPNKKINKFDSMDNVKSISDSDTQKPDNTDTDSRKLNRLDQVNRSLSDEEKSKGLQQFDDDEYSADFEHALEESKMYQDDSLLSKARNHFLSTHMLNENQDDSVVENQDDAVVPKIQIEDTTEDDVPPPLPDSKPPDISLSPNNSLASSTNNPLVFNTTADSDINEEKSRESSPNSLTTELVATTNDFVKKPIESESASIVNNVLSPESEENEDSPVNISSRDQQKPASEAMFEDPILIEKNTKDTNRSSLVKSRMLLFELGNKENTNAANISKVSKYFKKDKIEVPSGDIKDISQESQKVDDVKAEEKSSYLSMSSTVDDSLEDVNYKTIRSDIDNTDNLVLYNSTLSETSPCNLTKDETNSPVDLTNNSKETNPSREENILTKSIIENLSDDQTAITINSSLLEESKEEYPEDLNPFGDEEDPKTERQIIRPSMEDLTIITPTKEEKRESTNPFGSSDEEDEAVVKQKPPRPPLPTTRTEGKKVLEAPRVSLNPFWSDDEEPDEEVNARPVPMPRSKHLSTPEPKPRRSGLSNSASHYDSNSSISSMSSSISHTPGRKKKPAPPPPGVPTPEGSKQSSPSTSTHPSPKLTPKVRKNRKAPLPPSSTPFLSNVLIGDNINVSPIVNPDQSDSKSIDSLVLNPNASLVSSDIEKEKISKDEKNRNRQSQSIASPVLSDSDSLSISQQSSTDKSTHGKWKRKKGPAPARPVPQRRQIRPLPLVELRRELDIIEMQQQGLEKQGVKLEQLIREKCEIPGSNDETALSPEVEELVLELFELVNEKNELFRKQAELMYLRRQQRLEEEHADLEYQIRCLMERPERNKTDSDKAREEELINRLLEVVERRNEIVECLEMDRVREAEEDQSISYHLNQLASKKEEEQSESPVKLSKKEKKKMKKEKKLKEKGKTLDADKDIDESETSLNVVKDKKKKKWF